jgi:hypothetical protein
MKRVTKPATEDVAWRQGSSPPDGFILWHNHVKHGARTRQGTNGFRHGARYRLPSTSSAIAVGDQSWGSTIASTGSHHGVLVHPSGLVPDLDCRPAFNVADHPSRFEHNPRVGMRRAGQAALRYLHAADEHENVTVLIPVNLANRCFVTHGSTCRLRWTGYKSGGIAAEKVLPNSALMLLPQAFHIARSGSMQAIEPCVTGFGGQAGRRCLGNPRPAALGTAAKFAGTLLHAKFGASRWSLLRGFDGQAGGGVSSHLRRPLSARPPTLAQMARDAPILNPGYQKTGQPSKARHGLVMPL